MYSGPFHLAADLAADPKADHWLVPGLIPKDGLVILASAPKTGKTCLATAVARALATGGEWLGNRLEKAPVLWCAHEETSRERALLHQGLTMDDPLYIAYPSELPMIDAPIPHSDRFGRNRLENLAEPYVYGYAVDLGAKLIVIDCLHAAVERGNLAENGFAREVMGRLRRWSYNFHVPTLVLHHLTKSATRGHNPERFADSAQILAAASCHFFMERHPTSDGRSRVVLHGRGRFPAPPTRLELMSDGILDYRIASEECEKVARVTVETAILQTVRDGWTLTALELARKLDQKPATVRNALANLMSRGEVVPVKGMSRAHRYALPEDR